MYEPEFYMDTVRFFEMSGEERVWAINGEAWRRKRVEYVKEQLVSDTCPREEWVERLTKMEKYLSGLKGESTEEQAEWEETIKKYPDDVFAEINAVEEIVSLLKEKLSPPEVMDEDFLDEDLYKVEMDLFDAESDLRVDHPKIADHLMKVIHQVQKAQAEETARYKREFHDEEE